MTRKEQTLAYLKNHPEGVDDDELAKALCFSRRQEANQYCRKLAKQGLIRREHVNGKIHNFYISSPNLGSSICNPPPNHGNEKECRWNDTKRWNWEGNVQFIVIQYLKNYGCTSVKFADTETRQHGKDIEAKSGSSPVWITVKGWPEGTDKTQPSTQAGHWFKQGLFDVLDWRGESDKAVIAYALPDYKRYRDIAQKILWLQPLVKFYFIWVKEDRTVKTDLSL